MRRALTISVIVVAVVAAGCGASSSGSSGSSANPGSSSPSVSGSSPGVVQAAPGWPSPTVSDFVSTIDNPWFPLTTGRQWTSKGTKDGKPTVDTYTVTGQTKQIEGVTCSVIRDVLTAHGKPIEATWDWYAQDKQGNVWYFGLYYTATGLAGFSASTVGGLLWSALGPWATFSFGAATALAAAALMLFGRGRVRETLAADTAARPAA